MTDPIRFDGQVAVVTGAGRGLGAAYARLLAERGAAVMVHDAGVDLNGLGTDRSVADAVVAEIHSAGGEATACYEDLAADGACRRAVDLALDRYGRLDVLINNAGLLGHAPIEEVGPELLSRMVRVSVVAPFLLSQAAFPEMKRRRYGRIVVTTSGRAMFINAALQGLTAYSVGRGAQLGLMVSLAAEGDPFGIRVNAVSPVATTRMTMSEDAPPMPPERVAPGVAFLASAACDFSGVILRAAGGRFSMARYEFTSGVDFGLEAVAPEAIAERWAEIAGKPGAASGIL